MTGLSRCQSHYAPDAAIRLNATSVDVEAAVVRCASCFRHRDGTELSPTANLQEAAANLFKMLRELDAAPAASPSCRFPTGISAAP